MYQKIIEIMVLLLTELTNTREISDIDFEKLNSLGFSNEEITAAYSLLIEKLDSLRAKSKFEDKPTERSFRILNLVEKDIFTRDAWGEVINLRTLGMLTNEQIESLIDWSIFVGIERIDKPELYSYLAYNVFNMQNQLPNGSRYTLFGNDTVN